MEREVAEVQAAFAAENAEKAKMKTKIEIFVNYLRGRLGKGVEGDLGSFTFRMDVEKRAEVTKLIDNLFKDFIAKHSDLYEGKYDVATDKAMEELVQFISLDVDLSETIALLMEPSADTASSPQRRGEKRADLSYEALSALERNMPKYRQHMDLDEKK